jgi:hypothetical protein
MFWVFVAFAGAVFLAPVTAGPVSAVPPEDGLVAYTSDEGGRFSIWTMSADGTNAVNLTGSYGYDAFGPVWSPDGSRIAWAKESIFVMGVTGTFPIDITNNAGAQYIETHDISWSPDGAKFAYTDGGRLYTIGVNGIHVVELAIGISGLGGWSPDGTRIVYTHTTSNFTRDIRVVDVATGVVTDLTDGGGTSTNDSPAWSPDGSRIVFHSTRSGPSAVWVMNADGSDQTELVAATGGPNVQQMAPAWSPDGSQIAFVSGGDVWTMDADGTDAVKVTDTPGIVERGPVWSPTGTRLAFDNSDDEVWIVHPDGSGLVTTHGWGPAWQPVFPPVGLVDTRSGIWRLRLDNGWYAGFYYGNPGDVPFMGDWDCDGVDTPGLYRQSDGYAYLRNSNTEGVADIKFFFGNPGDIPLAGDWDGDGCDTLSIYRPSEQVFYIINELGSSDGGLGAADYSFMFGNPGDKPVAGDWDGDGVDEIGLHRESTGFFYWRDTLDTGEATGSIFFGDPGDRFVSGDWGTIPGRDTPAVFRPSNGIVYFRYSLTEGNADTWFPWPNASETTAPEVIHIPVAGNFGLD